jgi:hypothetical protein
MYTEQSEINGHASGVNNPTQRGSAPKWAALIDDSFVSSPQREVRASVLIAQAGLDPEIILVRDHGGELDVALSPKDSLDLAKGNVFYSVPPCDAPKACPESAPPKLALFVNDRAEVTLNPNQTGASVRELFSLSDELDLLRDHESTHDDLIKAEDSAPFNKGPVFRTVRNVKALKIIVNKKPFSEKDGVKGKMTGLEIASLVTSNPKCTEVFRLNKDSKEEVPLNKEITIHNCDEFRVIRNNVAGGFEDSRIKRELDILHTGGLTVELVHQPLPAVIYRNIPTRPGYRHVQQTDVLVPIPGGYPGAMIDGAYLPVGSPLINRVAGKPQGTVHAAGIQWQLISYHPHHGGGGPAWDKDKHGFHTYVDEILSWIHHARE